MMDDRGQGAFEYVLLIAGVLLIVILVVLILRGNVLGSAKTQIDYGIGNYTNVVDYSNQTV
ncbi:class III signal peptide-containing protein [Candidatus Micrarchaeota archaeon]|nr:class III signal peptide-containing protein [Candidatus Micrarchaeota archaeon]